MLGKYFYGIITRQCAWFNLAFRKLTMTNYFDELPRT